MPWTTKLLVVANRTIESEQVRDVIVGRAAAGPVQVMLVAPASSGAGLIRERRGDGAAPGSGGAGAARLRRVG
jgi:hypothetical protein